MANRSYLVVSDADTLYPSAVEANFCPEDQTIAQGIYCVPLLWFGLFRPANMRTQKLKVEKETLTKSAPLVEVDKALDQLKTAVANINKMFEKQGTVDEYAKLISEAIRSAKRKFITIEMSEIEALDAGDTFQKDVKKALQAFNGDLKLDDGRESLIKISEISKTAKFPNAKCLLMKEKVSDEAIETHSKIIGCSWIRKVPWEENTQPM